MKIAMMQPTFLPWQGFFGLVNAADLFIYLDDFQISIQSYHQRNRLFLNSDQVDWFTVPIKKSLSFGRPLNSAVINYELPWQKKILARIQHNYSKSIFYKEIYTLLESSMLQKHASLADLNISLINSVLLAMKWEKKTILSSQLTVTGDKSMRVLNILKKCDATQYFCAHGSFQYMYEERVFPVSGIETLFQDYLSTPYSQIGSTGQFFSNLSIWDALFNVGPEKTSQLIVAGSKHWKTWPEMVSNFEGQIIAP